MTEFADGTEFYLPYRNQARTLGVWVGLMLFIGAAFLVLPPPLPEVACLATGIILVTLGAMVSAAMVTKSGASLA